LQKIELISNLIQFSPKKILSSKDKKAQYNAAKRPKIYEMSANTWTHNFN